MFITHYYVQRNSIKLFLYQLPHEHSHVTSLLIKNSIERFVLIRPFTTEFMYTVFTDKMTVKYIGFQYLILYLAQYKLLGIFG